LILGFAGIILFACFASATAASDGNRWHFIAGTSIVVVSAVLWVCGTLYADKRMPEKSSNITNSCMQLLAAGIFAGIIAMAKGEWHLFDLAAVSREAWSGLLYLIVMGSLVAYLSFTWLVTVQPPAIVSTHTFVNPVVAIILGWLMAGEHISSTQMLALVVALAGVILAQVGKNKIQ
jgi:drug/metabolite transporter (DMT)-like permease